MVQAENVSIGNAKIDLEWKRSDVELQLQTHRN